MFVIKFSPLKEVAGACLLLLPCLTYPLLLLLLAAALFYIRQSSRYSSTNSKCELVIQPSFCAKL